jgi:membrane associated rhomboid family serine protease
MWSLYIFGGNLEDRIGSIRYFMFYILCGCASGISHLLSYCSGSGREDKSGFFYIRTCPGPLLHS